MMHKKHIQILYVCVCIAMCLLFGHSTQKSYKVSYNEKVALKTMNQDGEILSDYFSNQDITYSLDDILIIAMNKMSSGMMEVYFEYPYRVCEMSDFMTNVMDKNGNLNFENLDFYCMHSYKLDDYLNPKYIIVQGSLDFNNYMKIDIGLRNFNIYQYVK